MSTDWYKKWENSSWERHQKKTLVDYLLSRWGIINSADEIVEWIVCTFEQFSSRPKLAAILKDGRSYTMVKTEYWTPGPLGGWEVLQWYAEARVPSMVSVYTTTIGGKINAIRAARGLPRIPDTVLNKGWFDVGRGKPIDIRAIVHPSRRLGKL